MAKRSAARKTRSSRQTKSEDEDDVFDLDEEETEGFEGSELVVSIGPQTFSPIQYNSLQVAGVTMKVNIEPGETVEGAYRRARAVLRKIQEEEFIVATREFSIRVRELRQSVKRST